MICSTSVNGAQEWLIWWVMRGSGRACPLAAAGRPGAGQQARRNSSASEGLLRCAARQHRPWPRLARPPGPTAPQAPAHRQARTALWDKGQPPGVGRLSLRPPEPGCAPPGASRSCSWDSEARVDTRSLASRLDSGSSISLLSGSLPGELVSRRACISSRGPGAPGSAPLRRAFAPVPDPDWPGRDIS